MLQRSRTHPKRAKPLVIASPVSPRSVKPGRDEQRVRQRYLRLSKEVLTWRLRAEAVETQMQERKVTTPQQKGMVKRS